MPIFNQQRNSGMRGVEKIIQPKIFNHPKMKNVIDVSGRFLVLVFSAVLFLTGCSNDDEGPNASVEEIIGTYSVEDTDESDEMESYLISVNKASKGGSDLEITNFGDIMYVPVKANIKGNKLTIPAQTFKGKTMTIVISGSGTMTGNKLEFDYVIETDDDYVLEHRCVALKAV
jgi:hypothetical protein